MCDKGKLWYFLPAWFFWNRSKLMRENTSEEVRWWMLWGVRWGEETEYSEKAAIHNKNCGMLFKMPRGKKTNYVPSTMENSARVPRKTSTVLKAVGGGGLIKVELIFCCCTLYEVIWSIKTIHGIIFESIFAFLLVSKCFAQLSVCEICLHPFIQWMRKEFRWWSSKRRNIKKEAMSLLLRIIQGPLVIFISHSFYWGEDKKSP